jgi:hypothetical protein
MHHSNSLPCLLLATMLGTPSSAPAVDRPRLYFGPGDVPKLRERAAREPYATFVRNYTRVLDGAVASLEGTDAGDFDRTLLESQVGAFLHLITGSPGYAERSKRAFMGRLNSWASEVGGYDAKRRSSRISLFVSRKLQNMCTDYDLLASAGVLTAEERERARSILGMAAARLMERGDSFNPYDYMSDRFRADNWNSDRLVAVGMFALTFPDDARSAGWREHAVTEMTWQLEHALLPDGAWAEGTRYQGAVLRAMVPFAHALRRNGGPDFFTHPRFKAMFESMIQLQTPSIDMLGGVSLTPGIGDANWETVWSAVLGWAAPAYAESDPGFAARLMWAWRRAGSPFVVEFSPGNPVMGFLFIDAGLAAVTQPPPISSLRPGGYAILRSGEAGREATYFHFNVGIPRAPFQHQHHDRGSFSLIAWNTPLAVDPGVHDYAVSLPKWFVRSEAHNQVVVDGRNSREGGEITSRLFAGPIDYVMADLTKSVGVDYKRHVFFVKPAFFLIWDEMPGGAQAVWHLHVLPKDSDAAIVPVNEPSGLARIRVPGPGGVTLDVGVWLPERAVERDLIELDKDPYPVRFYTERDSVPAPAREIRPTWIKVRRSEGPKDFVTILHARRPGDAAFECLATTPTRDGTRVTVRLGKREFLFCLGRQESSEVALDGEAAVVLREPEAKQTRALLVNTRRFRSAMGFNTTYASPRTTIVGTSDSTAEAAFVRPIRWAKCEGKGSQEGRSTARTLLLNAARYNAAWIERTFVLDVEHDSYPIRRFDEHGIRPACSVVYALATLLKTRAADEDVRHASPDEVRRRTIRLLRGVAASHLANRPQGPHWGENWQSALWAALAGMGGWMLWDDLDGATRQAVAAMVVHEANRFRYQRVPYWNGVGGDTKAEENAWNAMVLNLAAGMLPDHPYARSWRRAGSELMVSAYATEADRLCNSRAVDGRTVTQWLDGYNALPGGVVVNHGFEHPDYMAAETMNLWGYLTQSLAGRVVPEAAAFNGAMIYRTFVTYRWPSPPFEPPGGTIYVPGESNVYYPRGVDWSRYDVSLYYLEDAWARVLGWDRALSPPAREWMRLRADRMLKMQGRHADGRMFAPGEYDTYPGAEQWVAWCLTDAYLALWLQSHGALGACGNWLKD